MSCSGVIGVLLLCFVSAWTIYDGSTLPTSTFNPIGTRCERSHKVDSEALEADVLNGHEKHIICSLARPAHLCSVRRRGLADEECKRIARAVGNTRDVSCYSKGVCSFRLNRIVRAASGTRNATVKENSSKRKEKKKKQKRWRRHVQKIDNLLLDRAYVSLCMPQFLEDPGVIYSCNTRNDLIVIDPHFSLKPKMSSDDDSLIWKLPEGVKDCGQTSKGIEDIFTKTKITNAKPTIRGQIPWQVALYRKLVSTSHDFEQFCGATIISEAHLLTAAHCFEDLTYTDYKYKAVVGDFDKTKTEDFEQEFAFGSQDIYVHGNFSKVGYENDIAIIKLHDWILFNDYVRPICLPSETLVYEDGLDCLVSGWGRTSGNEKDLNTSRTLAAARISLLNQEECSRPEAYGDLIKDSMFCAGSFLGGKDSCGGDSGGPIVCKKLDRYHKVYMIQYGIVSYGEGCGKIGKPGVYTRLTQFITWIQEIIAQPNEDLVHLVVPKNGHYDRARDFNLADTSSVTPGSDLKIVQVVTKNGTRVGIRV